MKERISYLFMQYYNNKSTRRELDEFFQIINRAKDDEEINELIKKVYDEIRQNNPSLTYINGEGKLVLQEPDWLHEPVSEAVNEKTGKSALWSMAATILVLITIGIGLWMYRTVPGAGEPAVVKKFTERTEHKYLLLADSTQVWLNGSSTIDYPETFDDQKREVYLSGEAYFDVKHADKIPFIIHTGEVSTVVLGTAFNIKAYTGQQHITVSVKRGKVRVMQKDKVISTLVKGQEVKINKIREEYKTVEKVNNGNDIGAWQQGYLRYEDESFSDIINDLQRVYNVEIKVEDEKLNKLEITTSFTRDIGAEKALQILCRLTDSELEFKNNQYVLK